ncbi:MAG TPA: hypothetical protein VF695_17200 [Sphingomonas sp.]|jgi:hypothetical protein
MDFHAQTFRNERVVLDHNRYIDCTFERVVLAYGGGPFTLTGCSINGFSFEITGDLGRGLEGLRQFAHDSGPKMVKALVDDITKMLRRADPIETFTIM